MAEEIVNTLQRHRCVVRNSEGAIVSRQARLRAVIWNEYRVCDFHLLKYVLSLRYAYAHF